MTRLPRCDSERQHGLHFVLQHLADGNAGPAGDHFADDLRVHADAHQRSLALQLFEFGIQGGQFGAQGFGIGRRLHGRGRCGRPPLRRAAGARSARLAPRFQLAADFADLADQVALFLPTLAAIRRGALRRAVFCSASSASRSAWSAPRAASRSRTRVCTAQVVELARARLRWPAAWRSGRARGGRRRYRAR